MQFLKHSIDIMNRMKKTDDMNLRCYMLLDKFITIFDIGIATAIIGDVPDESREKINFCFENIQEEIQTIMGWVMNERQVTASSELTDPIPESSRSTSERRRRNQDNTN